MNILGQVLMVVLTASAVVVMVMAVVAIIIEIGTLIHDKQRKEEE